MTIINARRLRHRIKWITLAMVLLCFFLALRAHAAEESAVVLQGSHTIDRDTVMLSDLFNGVLPEADRVLLSAPAPGRTITFDVMHLARLAHQYGLGWRASSYADAVTLTRAATTITTDMILAALKPKVLAAASWRGDDAVMTLDNRTISVDLPSDAPSDLVVDRVSFDADQGRFRAEVAVAGQSRAARVITVTGRAEEAVPVPVLTTALTAGSMIGARDLEVRVMPASRAVGYVLQKDQLVGRILKRGGTAGKALKEADVARPTVVTRGTLVTLRVETPVMQLTAQGRALQDGVEGDVVRVLNVQSNKIVQGTARVDGTVDVAPTATPSSAPRGGVLAAALPPPAIPPLAAESLGEAP